MVVDFFLEGKGVKLKKKNEKKTFHLIQNVLFWEESDAFVLFHILQNAEDQEILENLTEEQIEGTIFRWSRII